MSQPEISPLARRLAEENNVDWRGLHGSGAGGKVVERDVLEYLARVMAGEEDMNPTPEPVPEGMEAWPEEDIRSFQSEMRASSKGVGLHEIQQELSASDRLGSDDPATPDASYGVAADIDDDPLLEIDEPEPAADLAGAPAEAISEDIFLFEEDDSPTGGLPDVEAPAAVGPDVVDADLLLDSDETLGWDGTLDDGPSDDTALWTDARSEPVSGDLPDVFGSPPADVPADLPGSGFADAPALDDELTLESPSAAAPAQADDLDIEPLGDLDAEVPHEAGMSGWAAPEAPVAEPEATAEDDAVDAEAAALDAEEPQAEPTPIPAWNDATDADDAEIAPASEVAAPLPPDLGAEPGALPLVSYGTLLRRHVDVTALAGAQLAVGMEMGESEPLSPAPFLLRAAAKAVADGGWGDGTVAMVAIDAEGIRVGTVGDPGGRSFVDLARSLGAELAQAGASGTAASLAVADMSALEVDEAVLRLEAPLLTLGRILYDNQRGSYRSTLSLSGDIAPEEGARLLARVAELLDAPVRLLV